MAWRPLEHTADVGLEVEAASLGALFADAAAGLCDTITDRARVEPRRHRVTRLSAPALDLLLVEWLEELLFRLDAHGELWCQHEPRVVQGRSGRYLLAATSRGEPFDPRRHPQKVQIKAITYHDLEVSRDAAGWRARVLFDI